MTSHARLTRLAHHKHIEQRDIEHRDIEHRDIET